MNPTVVRRPPPFQSVVAAPTSRFATRRLAPAETGKRTLHESKYLPVFPVSCRYKPSWADRPSPCERGRGPPPNGRLYLGDVLVSDRAKPKCREDYLISLQVVDPTIPGDYHGVIPRPTVQRMHTQQPPHTPIGIHLHLVKPLNEAPPSPFRNPIELALSGLRERHAVAHQ